MESGPGEIERLREQVEQWRMTRRRTREAMPERLWQHAVELAKRHGTHQVAKVCNLNSGNLNKRLRKKGEKRVRGTAERAFGFVEVPGVNLDAVIPASAAVTLQVIDERGARLRVDYLSGEGFDVGEVLQLFWRRGQ